MNKSIALFKPADYTLAEYKPSVLQNYFGKDFFEASKGRWALYHILRSYSIKGRVLLPVYICITVLDAVKELGLDYSFYDLDPRDLNASVDSIRENIKKYNDIEIIVVASMYGNPADLTAIEEICLKESIKVVDDAAQSYGAILNGRNIGTFGDAGFIAFSPGKPTASYIGAFYWTRQPYEHRLECHRLYHLISFFNFYFNRINVYRFSKFKVFKILAKVENFILKIIDIKNDKLTNRDKKHIGGILKATLDLKFSFRDLYFRLFCETFNDNGIFRIIKNIRGEAKPHKIVILVNNSYLAKSLLNYLKSSEIAVINGYKLLDYNNKLYVNAVDIDGRVIELPIEDNKEKMDYLFATINSFILQQ